MANGALSYNLASRGMHLVRTSIIEGRPSGLCTSSCCCYIARPYTRCLPLSYNFSHIFLHPTQAGCTRPTAVSPRSNRSGGLITPNVVQRVIACMRPRLLPKSLGDSIRQAPGGMRFEIRDCVLAGPTQICFVKL